MRVTLLHYDVNRLVNEPGNKTVMKHFGHMPNIQLLYVAAVFEQLGAEVDLIDMVAMELDTAATVARIKAFDPQIIGMSVYTSHFHTASQWARHLKAEVPGAKILLGGVHTQIFPTETLAYNEAVDYVCVGEAEMVLPEFLRRLKAGESLTGSPGLVHREEGEIRFAGEAPPLQNLDDCPFPARHLVPNEKYFNFISTRHNYTVFNTSRGCPFRCLFCEAGGKKWRARSAKNVVDEFEACHERFGVREVDIFDSSFTIDKQRVLDICRMLIERGLHRDMLWNVRSRVDTIDKEMLEALKEAGCYRIFYGVESGNPQVLGTLRKMTNLPRVREVIEQTDRAGISSFGYFLVGCPGDTPETMRQTVDFAKSLPLDFAIFNALTPFPKTGLYEEHYLPIVQEDFWADYIRRPEPPTEFIGRPWIDMDDAAIRDFGHRAMLEFYFRPRQMLRTLRAVRSWEMFSRFSYAAVDMLYSYAARGLTSLRGRG